MTDDEMISNILEACHLCGRTEEIFRVNDPRDLSKYVYWYPPASALSKGRTGSAKVN